MTFLPEAAEESEGAVGAKALRQSCAWAHSGLEPGSEVGEAVQELGQVTQCYGGHSGLGPLC